MKSPPEWIQVWLRWYAIHKEETAGFSIPLDTISTADLQNLKPVSGHWIATTPRTIKYLAPQHAKEIRHAAAYLITLNKLQADAWQQQSAEWEAQLERIKKYIEKHGKATV